VTPRYPVLLDLADRDCLVVGGGVVAERKVRGLLAVDARVTVIAPTATDELARLAAQGELRWERRTYRADVVETRALGVDRWWFVATATHDPDLNAAIASVATSAGIWANDASASDGGAVALPAVDRRGALTLAVSTGGAHPGAAAWLRDLASGAIGPEHLTALSLADEVRAESASGARPDWRQAVDSGMLDLIREGHVAEAKERLKACLSSSSD